MPMTNNMRNNALERYGEEPETLVPSLMAELRTPYRVGVRLGVYPNSVRAWLLRRGWTVGPDGKWVAPELKEVVNLG